MDSTPHHPVVCFGEVLWDILPSGPLPGGAPMNVAYHLQKLGLPPAMISRIGMDDYGEKLVKILSDSNVSTEYLQVDFKHATGLVYANVNNHHEVTYDIVYPSAWDFIEWQEELSPLVEKAEYFVFGSLASRNKDSRDTLYQALELAQKKVLDINLRAPHYNRSGLEYLIQKADILKLNEAELELVTGWFSPFDSMEDRMKLLSERFDIETLVVTMGGEGAIVLNAGNFYQHKGYKVEVADTIGSGDSFLAGFLYQLLNKATISEALDYASALGAFVASKPGGCPDYDKSQINSVKNLNTSNYTKTIL